MRSHEAFVDPVWIEKYALGHEERYPWDLVVSFVMNNRSKSLNKTLSILEVGFGSGSNLWFAAREGFKVSGVEASVDAVKSAISRFEQDGLTGDLYVGDFCDLPFDDNSFDLAIDRASLVCVEGKRQQQAVNEVHRCLKPGGRFLHNTYTSDHASIKGVEKNENGMHGPIMTGSVAGSGQLRFSTKEDIESLFEGLWQIQSFERRTWSDVLSEGENWHSEWVVVAEKQ